MPGEATGDPERLGPSDLRLPVLCGRDYLDGGSVGVRAVAHIEFRSTGSPRDSTPKAAVYQGIFVYRGDRAVAVLDRFRAAAGACPRSADGGVTMTNHLRGP